ncbi:MAG: hypothetical protein HYY78_21910 [Betaproteobacteria bacterium]|nr:hypothetical protein [Betaproteobacteria bacterium]
MALSAATAAVMLTAAADVAGQRQAQIREQVQERAGKREIIHGAELYVPPRAKVKTLAALKKETERWNDRMNPKFTKQEIDDLVAYLNRDFYKLSK